jgi:hypothetical protein
MQDERPKVISTDTMWKAMVAVGVFRESDRISRCIIDMQAGHPVVMHIQRWGDERLLEVAPLLKAAEIREVGKGTDDAS